MNMKIPLQTAFALVAFAAVALAHAQSKDALESADRLYERSGLAVQLGSMGDQFDQSLAANRGKVPDDVLAAIGEAAKTSFAPAALRGDIVRTIAQKMSAADRDQALAWLEGAVGRRITLAEERSATTMTPENLNAFFAQQKSNPPGEARRRLIAELIDSADMLETSAVMVESVSLGVALGMDNAQPVQKRIGIAGLRAQLRKLMPPEQLRTNLRVSISAVSAYTYRDLSDPDLAAYVRFNRSEFGARYTKTMFAAINDALARASLRIGELMDAMPRRRV